MPQFLVEILQLRVGASGVCRRSNRLIQTLLTLSGALALTQTMTVTVALTATLAGMSWLVGAHTAGQIVVSPDWLVLGTQIVHSPARLVGSILNSEPIRIRLVCVIKELHKSIVDKRIIL